MTHSRQSIPAVLTTSTILASACAASADISVYGDPLGVYPSGQIFHPADIQSNGDVGGLNVYAGRLHFVNGILAGRFEGYIDVDSFGSNTDLRTTGDINLGTLGGTYGELNVFGDGTAGSAQFHAGAGLNVGAFSQNPSYSAYGVGGGALYMMDGATGTVGSFALGNSEAFDPGLYSGFVPFIEGYAELFGAGTELTSAFTSIGNATTGAEGELLVYGGAKMTTYMPDGLTSSNLGFTEVAEGSDVYVSGPGSTLSSGVLGFGNGSTDTDAPPLPTNTPAMMMVSNGGQVQINTGVIGNGARGQVWLDGPGTRFEVAAQTPAAFADEGSLFIGQSQEHSDDDYVTIDGFRSGAGEVHVTDSAALVAERDIHVGGKGSSIVETFETFAGMTAPPSTGLLEVSNGGSVTAERLYVNEGGTLKGDGGQILADVVLNGGTIAPGMSPGIMTILGDFTYTSGSLLFEIGGPGIGQFDQLFISGDFFASSMVEITLSFIDGFVPNFGDSFAFLSVSGDSSVLETPDNLSVTLLGLNDPSSVAISFQNGGFVAQSSQAAPVPLPAGLWLLGSGLGLLALRRRAA